MSNILNRREIPILIMVIVTLIVTGEYYFKIPELSTTSVQLQGWTVILAAFAMGFGIIAVFRRNIMTLRKMQFPEAMYSAILVGTAIITFFYGQFISTATGLYYILYSGISLQAGACIPALGSLLMFAASWRVFKIRTPVAALLTFFMFVHLFALMPVGESSSQALQILTTGKSHISHGCLYVQPL